MHRTLRLRIQRLNDQVNRKRLVEPSRLRLDWKSISIWNILWRFVKRAFHEWFVCKTSIRCEISIFDGREWTKKFVEIILYAFGFHPVSRAEFLDGMYTFFFSSSIAIVKISFLNTCTVRPTFLFSLILFLIERVFRPLIFFTRRRNDLSVRSGETMPSLFDILYHRKKSCFLIIQSNKSRISF